MVTKNVLTQGLMNFQTGIRNLGNQGQVRQSGDFSKTMSDIQSNQAKADSSAAKSKTEVKTSTEMKQLSNSKKPEVNKEDSLQVKPEGNEAMKASDKKVEDMPEEMEEEAAVLLSGQVLTQQLLEAGADQLEEQIKELVTDILDITEKELMDLLEESGLQLLDLLNPDNLKQLVLDANGYEDPISLATNEEMANQFQQLVDAMGMVETDDDLGITKEEVVNLLEAAKEAKDLPKEEPPVGKEDGKTQLEGIEGEPVKIIVEKETGAQAGGDSQEGSFSKEGRFRDTVKEPVQDTKPADIFVQNLASQGAENVQEAAEQVQALKEIVNQIVEQIKIAIKPESTSMEIQLNPENLGRVSLTVVSKNGLLTASFTAENQIAKEAIESQMQVLKDNLNEQGVKVEAIEVNVSQFGLRQNTESGTDGRESSGQQKKTGGRRINLNYFDEEDADVTEEEALAAQVLHDNGGTVDYTA